MIPVSSLRDVQLRWLEIKQHGLTLYGFLLYTSGDEFINHYIDGEGLTDIDQWTASKCGIFLLYNPPKSWIEYTKERNHLWWKVYSKEEIGHIIDSDMIDVEFLFDNDSEIFTPRQILPSPSNIGLAKQQVSDVLAHFGLEPTDSPCMIFFKDLGDDDFWISCLGDLLGVQIPVLRAGLRKWFGGSEFKRLLRA